MSLLCLKYTWHHLMTQIYKMTAIENTQFKLVNPDSLTRDFLGIYMLFWSSGHYFYVELCIIAQSSKPALKMIVTDFTKKKEVIFHVKSRTLNVSDIEKGVFFNHKITKGVLEFNPNRGI